MEFDIRTVFVLFEIEEMTTSEIATLLAIPAGTVASRLRRAREEFQMKIARLHAGLVNHEPRAPEGRAGPERERGGNR